MKEIITSIIFGLIFGWMILSCMAAEDALVDKYCSGLSGYEYGQCQAQIY